jgi:hypothetical protein
LLPDDARTKLAPVTLIRPDVFGPRAGLTSIRIATAAKVSKAEFLTIISCGGVPGNVETIREKGLSGVSMTSKPGLFALIFKDASRPRCYEGLKISKRVTLIAARRNKTRERIVIV